MVLKKSHHQAPTASNI